MIGVFDSGWGGLSLVKSILKQPQAPDILYLADHAYLPYGSKSSNFVRHRSYAISKWLIQKGCTHILIACNTATAAAIKSLRSHFQIPFFGIEPAVKPLVNQYQPYILATLSTLNSQKFSLLQAQFDPNKRIQSLCFPNWVEIVETQPKKNFPHHIAADLKQLPHQATISLSCTHYIFLKPTIQSLRPDLNIYDPTQAVVSHLYNHLNQPSLTPDPILHIISTHLTRQTSQIAKNLLGQPVRVKWTNI